MERVRSSVVPIVTEIITQDAFGRRQSGFGSGTGVIFDPSGLVLTNNHVIEGGVEITITLDDGTQMVADINPGAEGSQPQDLTVAGSTLYFRADDGTDGEELWKRTGTS